MASSSLVENSMIIRYQTGVDEKGNDVFKQQTLRKINPDVSDEDLVDLSDSIQNLLENEVSTIKKTQTYIISR